MATKYLTVMNRFLLALALCLFSIALAKAQNLEEEVEFNYIKAKYLLDTERYEEAIKEFTKIIQEEKGYKDAYLYRAKAKYAMAAYTGTKKDVLLHMGSKGIGGMAATLLGKADYRMGNKQASINSLIVAVELNKEDAQVSEYLGNLYEEEGKLLKACEYWNMSANMGSSKASIKAKKLCGSITPEPSRVERRTNKPSIDDARLPTNEDTTIEDRSDDMKNTTSTDGEETGSLDEPITDDKLNTNDGGEQKDTINDDETSTVEEETSPVVKEEDNMPVEDNTPNEIEVDEDLTLVIQGQGLGKRKILDQPNILILSDTDGVVAVDICVNKRGKVESAEFNSKMSTIAKKSLVSLAIRKSKDFWFEKSDYREQCGVIIFKIKGS
ncbi:MAG: hypothetical protein P1U56_01095 [Saprospiraceae bacterium]|nr:hypothetical protein [Saprospiraceae bacterium]